MSYHQTVDIKILQPFEIGPVIYWIRNNFPILCYLLFIFLIHLQMTVLQLKEEIDGWIRERKEGTVNIFSLRLNCQPYTFISL